MNYSLVILPDLKIDAEEFSSIWNQDPATRSIAQAESDALRPEKCIGLDPELINQGIIYLAGMASTIALDVIKDLIKDQIKKILSRRSSPDITPSFEVIVVQPSDKPVIVVRTIAKQP